MDWLGSKVWAGDLCGIPGLEAFDTAFQGLGLTDDTCEDKTYIREAIDAARSNAQAPAALASGEESK